MNEKQVDAAVAAYGGMLDTADASRLAFFRALWEKRDGCASNGTGGYTVSPADKLRAWYADGEPVFSQAPVEIDPQTFAAALSALASFAGERGGFPEDVKEAFERTKWSRVVAASSLEEAGRAPLDYLEGLADLLVEDGLTEEQARAGALIASLALRSQLEAPAAAVASALLADDPKGPKPLACPVCGSMPSVARVGGDNSTQGRGKTLWCAQCGTSWEIERIRCARCGTQNQAHLHYFNVEGDEAHRIATCDECGGYIRTVYVDEALAPFSFDVEDVVMARLDAIALDPRFARGEGSSSAC